MKAWKKKGSGYYAWVRDCWRTRGKPLDFKDHKYLKDIYQDCEGNGNGVIIYQKSAQIGITERMVTEALWLPDQHEYNCIYFFPTSATMGDLVQERIDQPINSSAYLSKVSGRAKAIMGKHADKIGLKRMSKGFVYFRGSNALPAITSVAGDAIFVDEVDRMTQENIPYFEKRLEHSELRWQRWASTPTITGFGINKMYQESDQTVYVIPCNHCGEKQELDFWKNVDTERKIIACVKCGKQIIPWQIDGEWVAKYPGRENKGYHLSQLYSPRLRVAKLIQDSEKSSEAEIQQFYNQNLGLPYESEGVRITDQDIENCKQDYIMPLYPQERVFMGVDVGKKLHYVLRTENRIVMVGHVIDFFGPNSLEELIKKHSVRGVVIDALPETRKVQEFAHKFRNKVKMCYYSGLTEIKDSNKYWNINEDKVNTNRTVSLDITIAEIKNLKLEIPRNIGSYPDFASHLKSTTRVIKEDAKGIQKAEYVEVGDDHILHACNYAKLATNIFNVATPEVFIIS